PSSQPRRRKNPTRFWVSSACAACARSRKSLWWQLAVSKGRMRPRFLTQARMQWRSLGIWWASPAQKPRCAREPKNGSLFVRRVRHADRSLASFYAENHGNGALVRLVLPYQHAGGGLTALAGDVARNL